MGEKSTVCLAFSTNTLISFRLQAKSLCKTPAIDDFRTGCAKFQGNKKKNEMPLFKFYI